MMIRVAIPVVLILAPIWFIAMSLCLHTSMTLPIFLPFVYFSHALNKVWRRHMLAKHGLNPSPIDEISRQKNAHIHQAYADRYGPPHRPHQLPRRLNRHAEIPRGIATRLARSGAHRVFLAAPRAMLNPGNGQCISASPSGWSYDEVVLVLGDAGADFAGKSRQRPHTAEQEMLPAVRIAAAGEPIRCLDHSTLSYALGCVFTHRTRNPGPPHIIGL